MKPGFHMQVVKIESRSFSSAEIQENTSMIYMRFTCGIIGVRAGGAGGAAAPPNRLQSRKVGQIFNISRAKSGKIKSPKAEKPAVCCSHKGSRAIFA